MYPTIEDTYDGWVETDKPQKERIRIYDMKGLVCFAFSKFYFRSFSQFQTMDHEYFVQLQICRIAYCKQNRINFLKIESSKLLMLTFKYILHLSFLMLSNICVTVTLKSVYSVQDFENLVLPFHLIQVTDVSYNFQNVYFVKFIKSLFKRNTWFSSGRFFLYLNFDFKHFI